MQEQHAHACAAPRLLVGLAWPPSTTSHLAAVSVAADSQVAQPSPLPCRHARHLCAQWGAKRLPAPPHSGVAFTSAAPSRAEASIPAAELDSRQLQAVEATAREAATALELSGGLRVALVQSARFLCCAAGDSTILLSAGAVQACWQHTAHPRVALLYLLAHETGHLAARHVVSWLLSCARQ